jgi:uncharacterized membrane protein
MKKLKATLPLADSQYVSEHDRIGLERLLFFSDAVFAIAITILVLDLRLPAGANSADDHQLLILLTGLWPKYLAYILSFWVIGLYWISHHRKFLHINRFDNRLLSLNLLLLMVVAFIPFPTAVLSEYGNRTATIFYALVMALAGLLLAILWWYAAYKKDLVDHQLNRQLRRREMIAPLSSIAIFLLSIGLTFIDQGLVRIFWVLILPISLFSNAARRST